MVVITSAIDSRDGVFIEREAPPSTAFNSMPHYTSYGGTSFSALPQKDNFGRFEPRQEFTWEASFNFQSTDAIINFEPDGIDFETCQPVEVLHDSVHCIGSTPCPGGTTFPTETFEAPAGMNSFGEFLNPFLEERSNWSELCDVGTSVRRAEVMPNFEIF